MNYKKYIAAVMALSMATGVAGCGSPSDSSSKAEDDFSATENVAVADTESIEAIPEGAEKEILYLGEGDLNPTKGSPEKSTELQLFESKGGKIRFQQTSNEDRFDNLAAAITANKDIPDIFKYEWLAFPSQVVKDMYQPIALNNPVMMFVIYSCIMLISWLGAKNVVAGAMKTGELSSVFTYVISAMMSLMMLSMIFVMISMSTASIRRISEILKETPDLHNGENPAKDMKDGSVDFNNVSFSYKHGSGKMVLNNIDLHIKSGETIGIIGSTGCGKTSLVNLISRLYDVDDGSVCVGGKDVRDYDMEYLRDQVSVVLQKNVLFSGTILDNLRWGNENATDAECIEACEAACADEFIERFPDKYETYIEQGGTNVSGGQKQRLCIARALLKKPKVLILDDSTSAVDTATDAKIRAAFAKSIPGTTKFIIAQRISSVQDADRIIVLDGGKVNGFDTHEKLVETNEIYREIYESQVKGGGDFDVQSAGKEEA